jgi:hypothetical protein
MVLGQSLELADAWVIEEISIVDVKLEDGWLNVTKLKRSAKPPTVTFSMDVPRLIECVRLIDQRGDTWRVVGEWNGIKRERDGLELLLNEGGQT